VAEQPKPATEHTRAANAACVVGLPLDDPADRELATRGLVATHPTGRIDRGDGRAAWDTSLHDFTRGGAPAPDTVNPSLWRQAGLNSIHGLFEVVDGVWQARGYDLSNVTFVAGDTGWIVIDPLTSAETAAACLALADEHLGQRPVVAVIYTHSHVDHFGGVHGVVDEADVESGAVRIIAPQGFMAEAVSENVIAGPVMQRRAQFMYGGLLPADPTGHVDAGLGKTTPKGTVGLIAPTEEVGETGTELVVDGVRIEFQYTPGTEAPAEMNFLFPDLRLLCMAENCTANMHNVYTPRGAQVRDALAWSKYIAEAIELFADRADVCFASHHWPRWGAEEVRRFLVQQRDLYRWLHDQTMRLANHGLTAVEIAEELSELPLELRTEFHARGYYGTVNHNVKAVYQRYLGWFDANPANLHPLPPVDAGRRYVELMGGADAVLAAGRAAFERGEYRWVAQLVNHLVFAEPDNRDARELQADALEQMGYQAESGPWRNFYLTGAMELRAEGEPPPGPGRAGGGLMGALSVAQIFDALGVRLNGDAAAGKRITINWRFTDLGEDHVLGLENSALHHVPGRHADDAAASVSLPKAVLGQILAGATTFPDQVAAGAVELDGDVNALVELFGCLDRFAGWFPIVTP
jgi:alkyl sulfatase BDS1-like metallo-beta-lactamase superfamily hydrolase